MHRLNHSTANSRYTASNEPLIDTEQGGPLKHMMQAFITTTSIPTALMNLS
ncbi:hypothetical protein DSO57_1017042 [Entomophthora muscae]|uniref:Uncharacterized protein n=1 Tax=Entomophthora muscae TaxID=34485 RepID=A0ACC2SHK8_9FUNG|nr:hypothetical protein DSO57_1017042 [Entomophthora muscae]